MTINAPPHPGGMLLEDVIKAQGLTITEAAERLSMSRVALSRVCHGHAGISPDLAVRLERAGVSTAKAWLMMQLNYDLARAQDKTQPPVIQLSDTHLNDLSSDEVMP